MDKDNKKVKKIKYCGECKNFLYEGCSGYGLCQRDFNTHSVNEKCLYE